MKKLVLSFFFLTEVICTLHAQVAPSIEWQKCYGGTNYDNLNSIQQTFDHGFIIGGFSNSNDGDVTVNYGLADYWVVKIDSVGNLEWQKSYGGSGTDNGSSIQQTTDGGFINVGRSESTDGDVTGNHGYQDIWMVRLDTVGNLLWQRSYGGTNHDEGFSIQQTTDGGFIVAGTSESIDGDVTGNHGDNDYWILKLNSAGNIVWQKSYGGSAADYAMSIQQTSDDGFIVAGRSMSNDGDVTGNHGDGDYWIVKLDTVGNIEWQKSLGGSSDDGAQSIQQTVDGGYIVSGAALSNDGDVTFNHGWSDYWIVKLNAGGSIVWQRSFGGSGGEDYSLIRQTTDNGYIICGLCDSKDGDVLGNHVFVYNGDSLPTIDNWVVKLDSTGNMEWQKSLGGSGTDQVTSIIQTLDGGYATLTWVASNDGDVSGNHGGYDGWVVKLASDVKSGISAPVAKSISLSPNPVQNLLTITLATQAANATIRVYDLQGKIITLPTTVTNTQAQLNTEKLPDGFYTLQIINNKTGESEVGKFVKQE